MLTFSQYFKDRVSNTCSAGSISQNLKLYYRLVSSVRSGDHQTCPLFNSNAERLPALHGRRAEAKTWSGKFELRPICLIPIFTCRNRKPLPEAWTGNESITVRSGPRTTRYGFSAHCRARPKANCLQIFHRTYRRSVCIPASTLHNQLT